MPNILFVRTCMGRGEGYMQNEILKIALGAFLGTSWAFLSFPASFLFVAGVFCDVSFCFVESLPF